MQELWEQQGLDYKAFHRGDVVDGTVVAVDRDGILVDVGAKSEGIIPLNEAQSLHEDPQNKLSAGDPVLVYVLSPENQEGQVVLSLDRARAEKGWRLLLQRFESGEIFQARVVDYNKGGLIVSIEGVRGFVPASHVAGLRPDAPAGDQVDDKLAAMLGRELRLKVIEINRKRNRLILSERVAMQEWRDQRRNDLLDQLAPGQVRRGRIASITNFGIFVDLGGADGLVHLSELAWGRVDKPKQQYHVGDEVDVYVLSVDPETKKIALSLRRTQPEPWEKVTETYRVGQIVQGTVTRLTNFGAFARLEDGIEGLIHVSELDERRINHPKEVVKEGDTVPLKIVRIETDRRRIGLSLRQAREELGEGEEELYRSSSGGRRGGGYSNSEYTYTTGDDDDEDDRRYK
jgi:small subunit ribosomal protein S1